MSGAYPVSLEVWKQQHDRCQCCGISYNSTWITPEWDRGGFEVHHIVYKSQLGTDEVCNLLCLCHRCHHQAAHNGHSKWNLTLANMLWVKKTCGDWEWDEERLLEMRRGKRNIREFTQGTPKKFTPTVLPDVYLEERRRWGYGRANGG